MSTKQKTQELVIDNNLLKKAALVYRAIRHPLRQKIMQLVNRNGEMTVTSIYKKLKLEQPVASQHLAILRHAGFMNTRRDGQSIFYSVNQGRVDQIQQKASETLSVGL